MKTRLFFILFFFLGLSCGTNNAPTDAQKEKIKREIKEVINPMFKAIEELDVPNMSKYCLNSPDFTMSFGGYLLSFKDFQAITEFFKPLINQKITIKDEKFYFIDSKNVMYSATLNCRSNFKEGYSVDQDPWASQFLLKLIDGKWMIVSMSENGVERLVKNIESIQGLNQTELIKQYLGKWVQEPQNDTAAIAYYKTMGFGLEVDMSVTAKGKEFLKLKQLYGYSKSIDKFIYLEIVDRYTSGSLCWFVTKTKNISIPIKYINNPSGSNYRIEDEFISPNEIVSKNIVNNKVVRTSTFKRISSK
jgi:hypothetical protein